MMRAVALTVYWWVLATGVAHASKLIAVFPLDVGNAEGRMDKASQTSLEEMLRDVATQTLRPSGWTILSRENMLRVIEDNGIDPTKVCEGNCQLTTAREIKIDKFITGSVQFVDGAFTASIRLIDQRTGRIDSTVSLVGKTTTELREEFQAKAADFFSQAEIVGASTVQEETTGELFLQVDPPDASFRVDADAPVDLVPGRNTVLTLSLGAHHLVVRKQGLQDYQQDFFIERGRPVTVRVTLLAPPPPVTNGGQAYLTIDSRPAQARIFLDGRDTGKLTPANFSGLAAGEHQIVLQRDLYLDWQQRITLKADDVKLVRPDLRSNFGTLSLVTDPPGATAYVDGRQQPGVTPLQLDHFEARAYRVRLTLPQYDSVEKTVVVQPGETTSLHEALKPQFGTLVLNVKPDGATVYLDDVQLAEHTPTTRERLGARTYQLRVTYPLYRDLEKTVRIEAGKTTVLDETLIPTTGGLVVTAEANGEPYTGADVLIDGVVKGQTPLMLSTVAEGSINVEVRAPLHRSWTTRTLIVAKQQGELTAHLVPEYGFVQVATATGTVTIDGQSIGPADGKASKVAMGTHHLVVVPDDPARYRPDEHDIVVEVGKTVSITPTLAPRLGSLVVQTVPPGARITLDGQGRGESPQRLADLFAGKHELRLELERYHDWTQEVTVEEGRTGVVDITLKSVDLVKYEAELRSRKLTRTVLAGITTGGLTLGAGAALVVAHVFAASESSSVQAYNNSTTLSDIASNRAAASSAFSSARTAQLASIALGAAAVCAGAWFGYELATLPPAPPETSAQ